MEIFSSLRISGAKKCFFAVVILGVSAVSSVQGMSGAARRVLQGFWPALRTVVVPEAFLITPENFTQARLANAIESLVAQQVARPFQAPLLATIKGPMTDRATLRVLEKNTPESQSLLRYIGLQLVKEQPASPFAQQFKNLASAQQPARALQEVEVLLETPEGKNILDAAVTSFKKTSEGKKLWPKLENSLRGSVQDMLNSIKVEVVGAKPIDFWSNQQSIAGRTLMTTVPMPRSLVPRTELRSALQLAKPLEVSVIPSASLKTSLVKAPEVTVSLVPLEEQSRALVVATPPSSALVPFKQPATSLQKMPARYTRPMFKPVEPVLPPGAVKVPSAVVPYRPVVTGMLPETALPRVTTKPELDTRAIVAATAQRYQEQPQAPRVVASKAQVAPAAQQSGPVAPKVVKAKKFKDALTLARLKHQAKKTKAKGKVHAAQKPAQIKGESGSLELFYRNLLLRTVRAHREAKDTLVKRWVENGGPLNAALDEKECLKKALLLFGNYNKLLEYVQQGLTGAKESLERVKLSIFTALRENDDWRGVHDRLTLSVHRYEEALAQQGVIAQDDLETLNRLKHVLKTFNRALEK